MILYDNLFYAISLLTIIIIINTKDINRPITTPNKIDPIRTVTNSNMQLHIKKLLLSKCNIDLYNVILITSFNALSPNI